MKTLEEKLAASAAFHQANFVKDTPDMPSTPSPLPETRNTQEVRLVGIAAFACWWFVILSGVGLVAGLFIWSLRF